MCKKKRRGEKRTNLTLVGVETVAARYAAAAAYEFRPSLDTRPDSHRRWFSYADAQSIVFRSMRNQHFLIFPFVMMMLRADVLSPPLSILDSIDTLCIHAMRKRIRAKKKRRLGRRRIGNQSLPSISSPEMAPPGSAHFHENTDRSEMALFTRQHHRHIGPFNRWLLLLLLLLLLSSSPWFLLQCWATKHALFRVLLP